MVLVVNDQQPYKTLKELVDDAKKNPDKLIFSSSGLYGALHLPTALFMKAAGIKMKPPADQRRRAGADRDPRQQFASAGDLDRGRAAARSRPASCERSPASRPSARLRCPDVPTLKELGYDVEFSLWVGMFAPKGTPQANVDVIRTAVKQAANGDQFKTAIANIGDEVAYLDQPDFAKFWDEDAKRVEAAVHAIGRV